MAESAVSEVLAAVILAKVSGREVPMATRVMAVTAALRPTVQPRTVATSATMAVVIPMKVRAMMTTIFRGSGGRGWGSEDVAQKMEEVD